MRYCCTMQPRVDNNNGGVHMHAPLVWVDFLVTRTHGILDEGEPTQVVRRFFGLAERTLLGEQFD